MFAQPPPYSAHRIGANGLRDLKQNVSPAPGARKAKYMLETECAALVNWSPRGDTVLNGPGGDLDLCKTQSQDKHRDELRNVKPLDMQPDGCR